ncbi:MAG: Ku protein, partial [Firmicutes bacterium]|nr:Ku protein [Bacillota bacterium]
TPLSYQRRCDRCDEDVEWEDIVRGYEYEKDRFVIINEEDLEKIPDKQTKTIDIVDFVSLSEIDPVYFDRTYYLSPDETGTKPYYLLHRAMAESGKIAVAKIVIRSKQSLAAVRVYDQALALETMFYPDEVRDVNMVPGLGREPQLHENELKMAQELIKHLAARFEPEKYHDQYREALLEVIHAKIRGEDIAAPEIPERGKVVDLMEALKASIEMTKNVKKKLDTGKKDKKEPAGVS